MLIFSPSCWTHREAISRVSALVIIIAFIVLRLMHFDQFPQTWSAATTFYGGFTSPSGPVYSPWAIGTVWGIKLTVWLLETGIYLGYLAAYLSRARVVAVADGFMETAFPLAVAGIPMLIALAPYTLPRWAPISAPLHIYLYVAIMGLILIGGLINLTGLLTLRRAFTIMTEARLLITSGIFRIVRHPLYSGHFIMFLGSLLLRFHGYTVILYILFTVGQVIRANMEERKLALVFPEYAAYKQRTGMFFPKPAPRRKDEAR